MATKPTWIAIVDTEACDQYTFNFDHEPTRLEVAVETWQFEGECEELQFYYDTIRYGVITA